MWAKALISKEFFDVETGVDCGRDMCDSVYIMMKKDIVMVDLNRDDWVQVQMEKDEFYRRLEEVKEFFTDFGEAFVVAQLKKDFGSDKWVQWNNEASPGTCPCGFLTTNRS